MNFTDLWVIGWAITFVFIGIETTIRGEKLTSFVFASLFAFAVWPICIAYLLLKAFQRQ